MSHSPEEALHAQSPRWQSLVAADRRVVGVLVEKAKTTPEAYPLSVNALRSGCNQKSNRSPLMEMEVEDIEESLERLRALGATVEVQSGSRVARFRHRLYDWLGVDKVELAVMAELLLRGAQTEGELRGRAARMEPIADLGALRPVLNSLKEKGLVVALSPEGRGHTITHALYEPRELDKLRTETSTGTGSAHREQPAAHATPRSDARPAPSARAGDVQQSLDALRRELDELRTELASLRRNVEAMRSGDS